MPKIIEKLMSYQGAVLYLLLTEYSHNWRISQDLSKAYLWYEDGQKLALRVGFGFSRFDIADQDSLQELSFIDKLILWPKAKRIRDRLTHSHLEKLL